MQETCKEPEAVKLFVVKRRVGSEHFRIQEGAGSNEEATDTAFAFVKFMVESIVEFASEQFSCFGLGWTEACSFGRYGVHFEQSANACGQKPPLP